MNKGYLRLHTTRAGNMNNNNFRYVFRLSTRPVYGKNSIKRVKIESLVYLINFYVNMISYASNTFGTLT